MASETPLGMSQPIQTPDETVEATAKSQTIAAVVATLPPRQRLALQLYLSDDLNPPEIAAVLGVSAVAVRKLLAKAHAHLKEAIPEL